MRRRRLLRRLLGRGASDRDLVLDREAGAIVLAGRDGRDLPTVGDDLTFDGADVEGDDLGGSVRVAHERLVSAVNHGHEAVVHPGSASAYGIGGPGTLGEVAEAPDRQELLTALTTEHFTLQGARSQSASESAARASLYILSVSSTLVALGFTSQGSQTGATFNVFALTVLPTLYLLGVFTFVRVVECGAEDYRYGVAINRIRNYYKQIAGDQAKLFLLSGHDEGQVCSRTRRCRPRDARSLHLRDRGGRHQQCRRWQRDRDRARSIVDTSLGVAASLGGVAALASLVALLRYAERLLEERAALTESIFPVAAVASTTADPRAATRPLTWSSSRGVGGLPSHRRCPDRTTSPAPRVRAPYSG